MSGTGVGYGNNRVSAYKGPEPATGATSLTVGGVAAVLDSPVRLPEGHLACRSCGVPVRVTDEQAVIRVEAQGRETSAPVTQRAVALSFLLCPACTSTADVAERLLAEHPRVSARLGSDSVRHRIECALDALAVLGQPIPATLDDAALLALLRHLTQAGATARWVSRFLPVIASDTAVNTCSPSPWAHVRLRTRDALRQGYGALLRERVSRSAPARRLPPPPPDPPRDGVAVADGCLMCGIGTQLVTAVRVAQAGSPEQAARDVWTPRRCASQNLGGPATPARLAGHLCLDCNAAVDRAGSMGPTSMEAALVGHLRPDLAGRLNYGTLRLDGLVGWGVLVARAQRCETSPPAPNETRWAHLAGIARLSERLSSALG